MDKKERATRLLNLIGFADMLDTKIKEQTDGNPTFCDDKEYKESKALLQKACIGILTERRD